MVVNIDSGRYRSNRNVIERRPTKLAMPGQHSVPTNECLTIGILNNMAGAAFKATERQFVTLLDSASGGIPVHMSFYMLPGLTRTESGGLHFASHYSGIDRLLDTKLDGLIVTGREPRMTSLRDEPYWESFTQALEWARSNTVSTIWSCLAAHAAVLHMDGICRRKSHEKNFGVFKCSQASEHALTRDLPAEFHVPHSRWNGVGENDLAAGGYTVLSRSASREVDAFVKQENSLFVFFQGHLEYETDTLMREYRRDAGRYIRGEVDTYPLLPQSYFDPSTEAALATLRENAVTCKSSDLQHRVATVLQEAKIENSWRPSAVSIYKNWLQCIHARKLAIADKVAL